MGLDLEKGSQGGERQRQAVFFVREGFYIFTLNLLSLLLPLSFLLISRLSRAQHIFMNSVQQPDSFLLYIFLYTNPTLLHILISLVSITALLQGLTGQPSPIPAGSLSGATKNSRLYTAWILLCTLQVCVGLGIEGTIAAGFWNVQDEHVEDDASKTLFLIRVIFFVGLHETMVHWSRTFVRPVVDDTVFGASRDERWVEKLVLSASFGAVWWWRLRDEVEGLMLLVSIRSKLSMGLGISDLVCWWLYYITVTIGVVRLTRGSIWLGKVLLCGRTKLETISHGCAPDGDGNMNDDKV